MKASELKQFRVAPVRQVQAPPTRSTAEQSLAVSSKPGPKPLPPEERLDADVTLKMTQGELDALNEMAWQLRTSRSALIRQFIAEGMERMADA